jgi:hypothetical protein
MFPTAMPPDATAAPATYQAARGPAPVSGMSRLDSPAVRALSSSVRAVPSQRVSRLTTMAPRTPPMPAVASSRPTAAEPNPATRTRKTTSSPVLPEYARLAVAP